MTACMVDSDARVICRRSREATLDDLVDFREKTLALTCVASLARLPQVASRRLQRSSAVLSVCH